MIDYPQAVLLGIIQGLAEFIPVSSTAHLRVIPALLSWKDPGAAYSAVIQLGTLISLLIYFRVDLTTFTIAAFRGIIQRKPLETKEARMLYYMALGTVPISLIGLAFSDFIEGDARSLYVIASALIGLAVILWITDTVTKKEKNLDHFTWKHAFWIGIAQCFALIPGASRSGTTLTMGLMLGFSREASMRFSFLLSIPAIGLSGIYELIKEREQLADIGFGGLIAGTLVSAVIGYAAIAGLLRYLRSHSTLPFVLYRMILGVIILILLYKNLLQPL
ncbi:MAG: undecaprenyl-diphosphatase UppP [Spirochaetia bacterium]|nr:undecaprenyl-diphosphatase UppP [Spirochaetia bacterium]